MVEPIITASLLIDALGGSKLTSEKIDRPIGTVASWKHRNAIPSEAWPDFIEAARQSGLDGVTADSLLAMHRPRRHSSRPVETEARV